MQSKNNKEISERTISENNIKTAFPKGFENLYLEEKIPFIIAGCIVSMTDFDTRHYGKKRICDILKGTCSRFILENGHHHNPYYGALKDLTRREIEHFIDEMVRKAILRVEDNVFPTIDVTGAGKSAAQMKKRIRIEFPISLVPEEFPAIDHDLYSHLWDIRMVQAKDEGVPPYCVVPNRTLLELCQAPPDRIEDLEDIHGFGPARTQRYGELFIKALKDYSKGSASR